MSAELSKEVLELLAPQERFEALRERFVFSAGRDACDLAYANPYSGPRAETLDAIEDALREERRLGLQYTPYGGATIARRVVSRRLTREHGVRFRWGDVVLTAGAMAALNVLLRSVRVAGAENEVVHASPCWLDYPLYAAQLGMRPVSVPLRRGEFRWDAARLADALTPHTRAVLVTQPDNPTGVVHTGEELDALGDVLRAHAERTGTAPLLISDECHRDYVDPEVELRSPAFAYDRSAIVYSFGKGWLLQGQRLGFAAVSPHHPERSVLARRLARICRLAGYATPTALMQRALVRLVALDHPTAQIGARRREVERALAEMGYEVTPAQATFFVYARCPEDDDERFVERLADEKVLVLPSSVFHHRGHFRISVTGDDEMLERALPTFGRVRVDGEGR